MSAFARLPPRLQDAIATRLGWASLRPVQDAAVNALLDGANAIILAPTAGGKTEAAIFPTLAMLMERSAVGLGALYIAPIKALLNNQEHRLAAYTEMVGLRSFVWHGDTPSAARRRFLQDPADLLLTTPESLEVMLISQRVDASRLFADLRVVIIDEIHALAGQDRGTHLLSVIERLARLCGRDVQRVGLSATVGNPEVILSWLGGSSARPGVVIDPPRAPARRELLVLLGESVDDIARDAASMARGRKSLFFCQSRALTETVAASMRRAGTEVFVHHSAVSQSERADAEDRFHAGRDACIVCTSTLELGIDVGDLDRVFQADAPDTVSSFLQRMGRTGRRPGQSANTTFFCQSSESVLVAIALVELARAGWVESVRTTGRAWPVLVHQLLAMSLAEGGVRRDEFRAHIRCVADFRGIEAGELEALVDGLVANGGLIETSGRLVWGPRAERRLGRRNFQEIYAVFSSPQSYAVMDMAGRVLGSLQQDFVDRLVEQASCFLLAGKAWAVERVQHDERVVRVHPAPRGRQPTWGGYLPQFLGFEVCRQVREVLRGEEPVPYLHPSAAAALEAKRAAFAEVFAAGDVEEDDGELRWWTFAGGRINTTLKHALLSVVGEWQVIPDNYVLKIRGAEGRRALEEARVRLREPGPWGSARLWDEVRQELPRYRLTKFQDFLPEGVVREMLGAYLLDVEGARGVAIDTFREVAAYGAHVRQNRSCGIE